MLPNLDVDLLRSFIAIADTGSFTRAAEEVNKTQSAVSMQMRRLEDLTGRPLFARDGRNNRITGHGEKLLDYARRMVKLNDEVIQGFTRPELTGTVRLGIPDDYADAILPNILARFSRTHPLVRVDVECEGSSQLAKRTRRGEIDLAVLTCAVDVQSDQVLRREPLVWVTSQRHHAHEQDVLPLAISNHGCAWRAMALQSIKIWGKAHRVAYATPSSSAIIAAVLAGLAVGAIPAFLVRPGMRILTAADGFPPLGEFEMGIAVTPGKTTSAVDALSRHIAESLNENTRSLHAAE